MPQVLRRAVYTKHKDGHSHNFSPPKTHGNLMNLYSLCYLDASTLSNPNLIIDNDGDGVSEMDGDCDDSNPSAYPGAELDSTYECMTDEDGDGWEIPIQVGEVVPGTDCDDGS